MLENQAKMVFLAIGSSLGNKERNICLAKYKLQTNGIKLIKSSNNYETLSWPNIKQPKYINAVIKISTNLTPLKLMQECLNIEKELGRKRVKKNEPRICDIDIIDYDQKNLKINNNNQKLIIPHPKLHERNFVLLPLYEIAKNWLHPKKNKKISELLRDLDVNNLRSIKQL